MSTNLKVVVITGSSSGIGRATAHLFAKKGFQVVVHGSTDIDKVNEVVEECNKLAPTSNHKSIGFVADFREPINAQILIENTIKHFGRLDAVVCCAGFIKHTPLDSKNWFEEFRLTQSINVDSHARLLINASPHLLNAHNASIVIATAVNDFPVKGYLAYYILCSALKALAKSLAVDISPNVRISSLSLGSFDTPALSKLGLTADNFKDCTMLRRCGKTDEIAENIWHISQEATYITGTDITIDGGASIFTLY